MNLEWRKTLSQVESKQQKLEAEKRALKAKLVKVIKNSEALSASTKETMKRLSTSNNELTRKEAVLESQLSQSKEECIRHEETCKVVKEQLESGKSDLARALRENESLVREKRELERLLDERSQEFAGLEAELEVLLDQQVNEVSRLKRSLDAQVETEAVTVQTLQNDHDRAVAKLKEAKKLIKRQNKIFHTLDSKLESTLAAIHNNKET